MQSESNPFAYGEMPLSRQSLVHRAANEFLGLEEERLLSTDRTLAANYGSFETEEFGRAWGEIYVYEGGNLLTDGYLSYDGILALRDIGSKVFEVRYNAQETEWDTRYFGRYECYAKKKLPGDRVLLAKWGDCTERQLVLTNAEYADVCEKIARIPDAHKHFPEYKTRVRPRIRGEHRYLIEEVFEETQAVFPRDSYGRRCYSTTERPIRPFDHGYGSVTHDFFLLGTPDVWTLQCPVSDMRHMLYRRKEGWGRYGKPDWTEIDLVFTHYNAGLFAERVRVSVYQLLAVRHLIETEVTGMVRIPALDERYTPATVSWDQQGATIQVLPDRFEWEENTKTIWFRQDVWNWIFQCLPELEGWYNAVDEEMQSHYEESRYTHEQ